jgi:hypothetical protein
MYRNAAYCCTDFARHYILYSSSTLDQYPAWIMIDDLHASWCRWFYSVRESLQNVWGSVTC